MIQLLDARHLDISKVVDDADGEALDFHVGEEGYVGSKLEIKLPVSTEVSS